MSLFNTHLVLNHSFAARKHVRRLRFAAGWPMSPTWSSGALSIDEYGTYDMH